MIKQKLNLLKLKKVLFFIACLSTLYLNFNFNPFEIVEKNRFDSFSLFSEGLIIGRISMSEKEGIFSSGGFPGKINDFKNEKNPDIIQQPFNIYFNDLEVDTKKFGTYKSQPGGQGMLYSVLNNILPFDNQTKFKVLKSIAALLTALSLTLFLYWSYLTFGSLSAILTLIIIILSPWLTIFGKSLWWSIWSYYLPFAILLLILHHEKKFKLQFSTLKLFIVFYLIVLFKCYFTGFEYITSALVMFACPLFFYSIYEKWSLIKFAKRFILIVLASVSAIISTVLILSYQFSILTGSFSQGLKHLYLSFQKRTSGATEEVQGYIDKNILSSLNASLDSVLSKYWNGIAIDLNLFIETNWKSLLQIRYGELILIFIISSLIIYIQSKKAKIQALIFTLWLSLLAPLSWFILFKGHSHIHTHLNFITWYMPFCLFGFTVISYSLLPISKAINETKFVATRYLPIVLYLLIIISSISLMNTNKDVDGNKIIEVKKTNQLANKKSPFNLYIYENRLWYELKKDSTLNKERKFFLHIIPQNIKKIKNENSKKHGFENFDFSYAESLNIKNIGYNGIIFYKKLPSYDIKLIKTGQFNNGKRYWQSNISLTDDTN